MTDWYQCRDCNAIVDEFQQKLNNDKLCNTCAKKWAIHFLMISLVDWSYYDRLKCNKLSNKTIHHLLSNKILTHDEILDVIKKWLIQ